MLIRIGSPDNGRIKLVRKLGTRKGRTAEGRFVIEGLNLCREAVRRSLVTDFIMIPEDWKSQGGSVDISGLRSFIEECIASDELTVCSVPARVFADLTDAVAGAGILAVLNIPKVDPDSAYGLDPDKNILVLDRLQDPGNIGTMIRTAVAAGYGMIIAAKGTADIYSAKVLRSTAGLIFEMPVVYAADISDTIRRLRSSGRRIVVTDPSGGRAYYEEEIGRGIALVIGNEGNGISDELMELADVRVTLPMRGEIESLNAAVSAAILMYEAVRAGD